MSLLNSAKAFLIESLDNYRSKDDSKNKMAFAILHAMIALELFLKERLRLINPNLVCENIDIPLSEPGKIKKTVQFCVLPTRLENLGVQLNKEEKELIRDVSYWRNDIAHYIPTHDGNEAAIKLGGLYKFIFTFLEKELCQKLHEFLPEKYHKPMKQFIDELNNAIIKAKQKARKSKHQDNDRSCPFCYVTGVVEVKGEDYAYCYFCKKDLHIATCAECDKPLDVYSGGMSNGEYCNDCIENAGDLYVQQLIDQARGK